MRPLPVLLAVLFVTLAAVPVSASDLHADLDAALSGAEGPCATGALAALRARWPDLTDAERHELDWRTSPLYRGQVAAGAPSWLEGGPDESGARDLCYGAEVISASGDPYEFSAASEHFVVHWNNDGLTLPDEAEDLLVTLEASLVTQTTELGYRPPPGLDDWQMVVALEPLQGLSGYASALACGGDTVPFIVFSANLLGASGSAFIEEVVAHELFHTIQVGYAFTEPFLGYGTSRNSWFVEASAAYQQGVVVPDSSEYLEFFSLLWASEPWLTIETLDGSGHQYGMFVFPLSVEANQGDATWHRELWEHVDGRDGYALRDELEEVLAPRGSSFLKEYGDFLARGADADFPRYDFLFGVRDLNRYA